VNGWWRQFLARGVVWRKLLRVAVLNTPIWIEPSMIGFWSLFFLLWGPGRRGVMRNLRSIKPGSWPITNFFRAYRVFWNFAWSIADAGRFRETETMPDWEFAGIEDFDRLQAYEGGGVILTAHMGSYDLGAQVFSATSRRPIVMVRAPEVDPQTHAFEESLHAQSRSDALRIDFNTKASELALELLHAIQHGELVAIQGDRVTPGIATIPATLFGEPARIPAGPFALAMAARVPVFPVFIVRVGRRRYRLVTCPPIHVERRSRLRDDDLRAAAEQWAKLLEAVIARGWYQWFAFEPYAGEAAV
jgi:phosphatidylinositol dimannoside acyltransferase